jgi:hypothetical protein
MKRPYRVFCSNSREDQQFLEDLKKHLMSLQREGLITIQADIDISSGKEWKHEITHHLETADIILLLISPDFIASDYCFTEEMQQAIARHEQGTARVVPIVVRPTDWQSSPVGKLRALPQDTIPVSISQNRDTAFLSITEGLRIVIQELSICANQEKETSWLQMEKKIQHIVTIKEGITCIIVVIRANTISTLLWTLEKHILATTYTITYTIPLRRMEYAP